MLKVTESMIETAKELMQNKEISHIKDGKYDYFTSNHQTVAVTLNAGSTRRVGTFKCSDFAIIDSYDFK